MPRRSSSAVGPRTKALLLCNPGNPTGYAPSREDVAAVVAVAERHGLVDRHRRGLRGVAVGRRAVHLGLRARRRRDRDPQPRQEPLDAAAAARLPRRAGRAGRPLHAHARVGLPPRQHRLPGGGAGGTRRPARLARARSMPRPPPTVPSRSPPSPRRRGSRRRRRSLPRSSSSARPESGLAEQLEAVGLPVVDGAAFEGPGYARLPFGGAAEARAPAARRARPLGRSSHAR